MIEYAYISPDLAVAFTADFGRVNHGTGEGWEPLDPADYFEARIISADEFAKASVHLSLPPGA